MLVYYSVHARTYLEWMQPAFKARMSLSTQRWCLQSRYCMLIDH